MSDAEKPTVDLADSDAVVEGEDGALRVVMAKLAKHGETAESTSGSDA